MIQTFIKKSVKIKAIRHTGDNYDEISDFVGSKVFQHDGKVVIKTHAGYREIKKGDWIIREDSGEYCLCNPYVF